MINGIIIIGLYINGKPKINGSLILNKEGINANLPIVFNCFDLLVNARNANPNVAPEPPIAIKFHQNGAVTT